jgi:hypothetical protein
MATEEFGAVTFGKGGEVIPLNNDNASFEFPDEVEAKEVKQTKKEAKKEKPAAEVDIEIVDDTPEEDQGREKMQADPLAKDEDDELLSYDKKVQKRIKKLTKGYHDIRREKEEADRQREEAIRVAKFLVEENKRIQETLHEGSKSYIEQGKISAETELAMAKKAYKEAYEAGDSDALVEAQLAISEATLKLDRARTMQPIEPKEQPVYIPEVPQEAPQQDKKLTKWLDKNPWYGGDDALEEEMTSLAVSIHNRLAREKGEKFVGTDDYYEKISDTIRKRFPDYFGADEESEEVQETKPVKSRAKPAAAVVAPATRSVAPKKVQLTPSQVQIAKRLGVPLELYASQVAKQMNGDR